MDRNEPGKMKGSKWEKFQNMKRQLAQQITEPRRLLHTHLIIVVGKPEGMTPLWRPRRRWEDNIKMDLQEVEGVVGTGWSGLRIGTGGGHL
jgi:hypothetical protein